MGIVFLFILFLMGVDLLINYLPCRGSLPGGFLQWFIGWSYLTFIVMIIVFVSSLVLHLIC